MRLSRGVGACGALRATGRTGAEDRAAVRGAIDGVERLLVGGELRLVRANDRDPYRPADRGAGRRDGGPGRYRLETERGLAAAHHKVDVGEDARVLERAVQVAPGIVDVVALAEGVETVALARVQPPRQRERVADPAALADTRGDAGGPELRVEEADVELGVVDHELCAVDEREELLGDFGE